MIKSDAWNITDKANDYLNDAVLGASGVATSVTRGVGDVVSSVSSGMSDMVHNVASGVTRMVVAPPDFPDSFIRSVNDEEDRGDSPGVPAVTPRLSTHASPSTDSNESELSGRHDSEFLKEEISINTELGLREDYFSEPEGGQFEQSTSGLEESINHCKELILQCDEVSSRRRALVHKLIKLRYCLQTLNEEAELVGSGVHIVMGHQLEAQQPPITRASKQYCDKCAQIIWGVLHVSYICKLCDYQCHGRCLQGIRRRCAFAKFKETPFYTLRICPEIGLSMQDYKCAECATIITSKNAWAEPRLCDYSGRYYCPACHWNTRLVLPSRVIHNWDFEEKTVSRQAKQFLNIIKNKAILDPEVLNPFLFRFVEELNTVKKLREDILIMKKYLISCRVAQETRLLRMLEHRQHFVENSHLYSLQDLIDTNSGVLLEFLSKINNIFRLHIKEECDICKGKGFICEVCQSSEVLYPFDSAIYECDQCFAVFHHKCFTQKKECSRCTRHKERKQKDAKALPSSFT